MSHLHPISFWYDSTYLGSRCRKRTFLTDEAASGGPDALTTEPQEVGREFEGIYKKKSLS